MKLTESQRERSRSAFRVNPSLLKKVYAYDPECAIRFDHKIGKWCLFKRVFSKRHSMNKWQAAIVFEDDNGMPLGLDNRILEKMALADLWKQAGSPDELARQIDAKETAIDEKVEKDFKDDMDYLSRENKRQLDKAYSDHTNQSIG